MNRSIRPRFRVHSFRMIRTDSVESFRLANCLYGLSEPGGRTAALQLSLDGDPAACGIGAYQQKRKITFPDVFIDRFPLALPPAVIVQN